MPRELSASVLIQAVTDPVSNSAPRSIDVNIKYTDYNISVIPFVLMRVLYVNNVTWF